MKLVSLLIMVLMFAVACEDKPKQITADILTNVTAKAAITALDCEAVDVVKADIKAKMYAWFKLNEKSIGQDICKTAIAGIVPQLISTTVPATWVCKQRKLENAAEVLADFACSKLL